MSIRLADLASLAAILGIAWWGVFVLPYSFPPKVPVFDSPSYNVGFNNSIAAISILGVIGLLCLRNLLWRPLVPEPMEAIIWTGPFSAARRWPPMPRLFLFFFWGIYMILTCFLYAYIPRLEEYGEPAGAIPRLQLALGANLSPYRDFDFPYGPLLLYYPALVIKAATELFSMNFEQGYLLSLLIAQGVGLWALFFLVDHFRIKTGRRMVIFSAIAIAGYDIGFGIAGTMLRYVVPFVIALTMHKFSERVICGNGKWTRVILSAVSGAGVLSVFSISLEFGCVFLVAHAAYCAHRAWFRQRIWVFPLLATLACYPIWVVVFPGSLDRVMGAGRSFSAFPIVPAAYIVLYLLSLFWLIPILLRPCASWKPGLNAPLLLQWAVLLLGVIPAALGRCEHHHVLLNGMGTFILTFGVAAAARPRAFPFYTVVFVVIFGVVWRAVDVVDYGQHLTPVRLGLGGALPQEAAQTSPLVSGLELVLYHSIAAPMGIDRMTKKYLFESGRLAHQYYMDYGSVASQVELERKIRDLKRAEYLLVPQWILQLKEMTDAEMLAWRQKQQAQLDRQQSVWLGFLFLYPMDFQTKRLPFDPMLEEARYIARNYEVIREASGFVLMKPRIGN